MFCSPYLQSSNLLIQPFQGHKIFSDTGKCDMVFKYYLQSLLNGPLTTLINHKPECVPFLDTVDTRILKVPDYYDVVKNPMHLYKVREKLDDFAYTDPWDFIADVYVIWDNAWLYNKKSTKTYRSATKLAEVFDSEIEPVMISLGYCCGKRYTFYAVPISCFGKEFCQIERDTKYYSYINTYFYCEKCFDSVIQDFVSIWIESELSIKTVQKTLFDVGFNDATELEPMVKCRDCEKKYHEICVLRSTNIFPNSYVCNSCLKANGKIRSVNAWTAKSLPRTELSECIEARVNNFLREHGCLQVCDVVIRVLSASDKTVTIFPKMKKRYVETGRVNPPFPYRLKTIYAFQVIDGLEVCFFGMQVQEYGSDCPPPNTGRVYISYLDSVTFFRPREHRTGVYHEILLGYLESVKGLGYTTAHLWACPPADGVDYMFYCHPPDQKLPNGKRLQDWYTKLLMKGVKQNIVLSFKNLMEYAVEQNLSYFYELPYFEGDYWPSGIEEFIEEFDKETEAEKVPGNQTISKIKPSKTRIDRKVMSVLNGDEVSIMFRTTLIARKQLFFVILLQSVKSGICPDQIIDPDPLIKCDLMDGRDRFLTLARENHFEFSTLRRAKFSTMVMLYELHHPNRDQYTLTCNECGVYMKNGFHCPICPDFDLCLVCYKTNSHLHNQSSVEMEDQMQTESVSRTLIHALRCCDKNCNVPMCSKYKKVRNHVKNCSKKTQNSCLQCVNFIRLMVFHAKSCVYCNVSMCEVLKTVLRKYQIEKEKRKAVQRGNSSRMYLK